MSVGVLTDHVVDVLFSFILGENKHWQASEAAQVPRCPNVISEGFYVRECVFYVRVPRGHQRAPWKTVRGNSKRWNVLQALF